MSGPRTRLDQAMNARRLDLRKQWKDIAQQAGVSTAALGAIRRGEYNPSTLTARGIEDALKWEHGSIAAILAGGDPAPLEDSESADKRRGLKPEPSLHELAEQMRVLRLEIEELRERDRRREEEETERRREQRSG